MSEDTTGNMNAGRSFEDRVFLRFDALDASIRNLDERVINLDDRVQRLEERSFDTKPIWEQALKEIAETRYELSETKRELLIHIDKLVAFIFDMRADLRAVEGRVEKLETKPSQ